MEWKLRIRRLSEQTRDEMTRTVGAYKVFHDDQPAPPVTIDGVDVPLFGVTVESRGPSQNAAPASATNPSRILAGRYPLVISGGPDYTTHDYRQDLEIQAKMPGLELADTGGRTDILIHPGKDEFLSSIGCINLCTALPDAEENIGYAGSRRRVIALIADMAQSVGALPTEDKAPISSAFVDIDERALFAFHGSIDGDALAAQHNVLVKPGANIAQLHQSMAPVIANAAPVAQGLGLPQPVITSGNDSTHMHGSLHYKGRALDFRGNNISVAKGQSFAAAMRAALGSDYDVAFETFANASNNHLHVEYDP